jgi:hypothetical protein
MRNARGRPALGTKVAIDFARAVAWSPSTSTSMVAMMWCVASTEWLRRAWSTTASIPCADPPGVATVTSSASSDGPSSQRLSSASARDGSAGAAGCEYERKSATTRPRNRTIAAHVDCDPGLGVHRPDVGVHSKGSRCARVPRARDSARAGGSLAAVDARRVDRLMRLIACSPFCCAKTIRRQANQLLDMTGERKTAREVA